RMQVFLLFSAALVAASTVSAQQLCPILEKPLTGGEKFSLSLRLAEFMINNMTEPDCKFVVPHTRMNLGELHAILRSNQERDVDLRRDLYGKLEAERLEHGTCKTELAEAKAKNKPDASTSTSNNGAQAKPKAVKGLTGTLSFDALNGAGMMVTEKTPLKIDNITPDSFQATFTIKKGASITDDTEFTIVVPYPKATGDPVVITEKPVANGQSQTKNSISGTLTATVTTTASDETWKLEGEVAIANNEDPLGTKKNTQKVSIELDVTRET
ncbi:hypothetical protein PFISCL1PPCAC_7653, partial [Pristionchus fissidentatus]